MQTTKRHSWLAYLMIFLIPIVGMALGVAVTFLLKINQSDYGNLVVNLFFLTACVVLILLFKFSPEYLGLKFIKERAKTHVFLSLVIFTLYILFYIFVIRISAFKPFSAATLWGLLTYLIVIIAEELYFRGILYGFIQEHFSARTALIVTSIIFGLFHAGQGLRGIVSKTFTGWLWGSLRYSSGMIFLLIFPIHFMYNSIWLLFKGNWTSPPVWAVYTLPAFEFMLGSAIVIIRDKQSKKTRP